MNKISERQNTQTSLERLAAQRELYSSAKRIHILQIVITVIVPITLAFIALCFDSFSPIAAIVGVAVFIMDSALVEPQITKRKNKAAKIQELFDCEVLELPKSALKVVDDVTVEEVLLHYDAHVKIPGNMEKIRDWYSPLIERLPLSVARIICQRTNCWWDSKLRMNYASFLKYLAIAVFSITIIIGLSAQISLITFALICSALVPLFQFCIKQSNDNQEAATRLDQLVQFSLSVWNKAIDNCSDEELLLDSRKLQDEIYEHRRKCPLILDYYYRLFRDKDETLMNRSSAKLVQEAEQAL